MSARGEWPEAKGLGLPFVRVEAGQRARIWPGHPFPLKQEAVYAAPGLRTEI